MYRVGSNPKEETANADNKWRVGGSMQALEAKGSAHDHTKRKFGQNEPGPMEDDVQGSNFSYIDKRCAFDGVLLPVPHTILSMWL